MKAIVQNVPSIQHVVYYDKTFKLVGSISSLI